MAFGFLIKKCLRAKKLRISCDSVKWQMKKSPKIEHSSKLLEQTRFIRLAQRKRGDEMATHCQIRYGMMIAYDRVLAAGAPILETDLECCPQSEMLLWALEQCGSYSITQGADGLVLRSDAFTGIIPVCDPAKLTTPTPDAPIAPLGDAFRAALKVSGSLVKESASTLLQSCAQIDAGTCIATDGFVILQAWHGFDMPSGLLVPKAFIDALVKTRKQIVSFGYTPSETFTVHFSDQSWLRTHLYRDKIPSMAAKLKESEHTFELPKEFFKEVVKVAKWSEDGRVYFYEDVIRSHKTVTVGCHQSFHMPEFRQGISYYAGALGRIASFATHFDDSHEGLTMFYGTGLRGAIVHDSINTPKVVKCRHCGAEEKGGICQNYGCEGGYKHAHQGGCFECNYSGWINGQICDCEIPF